MPNIVPNLTVVYVPMRDSWPCERCEAREVVAYVAVDGVEETTGYCAKCLAIVVVNAMSVLDVEVPDEDWAPEPMGVPDDLPHHGSAKPLSDREAERPHDFESEAAIGDFDGLTGPCAVCGLKYRNIIHHR